MDSGWEFWIDVGGTFTDCLARDADGHLQTCKVLSSGIEKGRCEQADADGRLIDSSRIGDPPEFWAGYQLRLIDRDGQPWLESRVKSFDAAVGAFELEASPGKSPAGSQYELDGGEEAPLLAIRRILRLPLSQPFPRLTVKLGTTRGTNALLTRTGARTLLLCTRGTADVLLIGNQDRPRLFDLAITKPIPIFEQVIEVDERLDARGNVVQPLDEGDLCTQLAAARSDGIESVAICLLHSFANPAHEERLEELVRAAGFAEVSRSSEVAPLIKLVSRGDTTVMNAYLNPILRQYVGCLRKALADSRLMIMTSAGGLVDADRFIGKDSILSGPAGGVIGFARVARQAGFGRAIGFDMGGTSTAVARYAGRYDMEYETKKAGVRIVSPMLAIETVAAGGGSVCKFDGVQLSVGPDSAGANPGPACYGRGGPLTVTDVNLHLGRIIPEQFPFPLDTAAVTRQLEELCDQIADSPLGRRYSTHELAEGFRQIANVRMARAIRDISMARGFDPADDVLVSFGGAGAQHACSIARSLGMRDILIHPYSGILSAYGIGMADVRRYGERSVLAIYTHELQARLETLFVELEQSVREQVLAEGVAPERIQPVVRALEMRYRGTDATLLVTLTDEEDAVSAFIRTHEHTYE